MSKIRMAGVLLVDRYGHNAAACKIDVALKPHRANKKPPTKGVPQDVDHLEPH
jgi:hypothetical protein